MSQVIIYKEIKEFLLIISKQAQIDICQNGSIVTLYSFKKVTFLKVSMSMAKVLGRVKRKTV